MSTIVDTIEIPSQSQSDPTAEEMKIFVQAFVDKFIGIADFLEVKRIEDHTYGAFFFLGEKGKNFSIMAIGNVNHVSQSKQYITIHRINGLGGTVTNTTSAVSNTTTNTYISIKISGAVWLKYCKSSNGMMFGFYDSSTRTGMSSILTRIRSDVGSDINFLISYNGTLYSSHVPNAMNENTLHSDIPDGVDLIVPGGKQGIMDVYFPPAAQYPYLKFFSSYYADGTRFEVAGKRYVQAVGATGHWSIIMEID